MGRGLPPADGRAGGVVGGFRLVEVACPRNRPVPRRGGKEREGLLPGSLPLPGCSFPRRAAPAQARLRKSQQEGGEAAG